MTTNEQSKGGQVRRLTVTAHHYDPMHARDAYEIVLASDFDATAAERDELKARNAELVSAVAAHHFVTNERDRLREQLAAREAECRVKANGLSALQAELAGADAACADLRRAQSQLQSMNEALAAEAAKYRSALETFSRVASEAATLNDQDHIRGNAIKAHKLLMALAGYIPGYRPDIDEARAALASSAAKGEQKCEECAHCGHPAHERYCTADECQCAVFATPEPNRQEECETCGHDVASHTRRGCLVINCPCGHPTISETKP